MASVSFPLNEIQISLLKLTDNLQEDEVTALKKLILAFKAQRLAMLADKVWQEKGWDEETMQAFLQAHLRTSYPPQSTKTPS